MSYLTRLLLNPHRRNTQRILANPHNAHGAVLACFPPEQRTKNDSGRILWRLDESLHSHTLWISSPDKPDCSHLCESAGWQAQEQETRALKPLFEKLEAGQHWGYVLHANPTKAALDLVADSANGIRPRGKRVGIIKPPEQLDWLRRKGDQHGFSIPDQQMFVPRIDQHRTEFRKGKQSVTMNFVRFTGLLRVEDPDSLIGAIRHGIGAGKAYGAGMISLFSPTKVVS